MSVTRNSNKSVGIGLKYLIELASAVSGLSFIVSAIIYETVFYIRGFSTTFLEIANFEDVVMGGLRLLIELIVNLPLVAAFVFGIAVVTISVGQYNIVRNDGLKKYIAIFIVSVFAATRGVFQTLITNGDRTPKAVLSAIFVLAIFIVLGLYQVTYIVMRRKKSNIIALSVRALSLYINRVLIAYRELALGVIITATVFASILTWQRVSNQFLHGVGVLSGDSAKLVPCAQHRIIWLGSSNIVVRCSNGASIVVRAVENVVVERDR